jgi:serine/threonine protein kinase
MGYEGGESWTFGDKLPEWLVYPEPVESYRRGKLHPVKIGDTFQADRYWYKIIRKLGHGSFSTVWLAEDTRYHPSSACIVYLLTRYQKVVFGTSQSKS